MKIIIDTISDEGVAKNIVEARSAQCCPGLPSYVLSIFRITKDKKYV